VTVHTYTTKNEKEWSAALAEMPAKFQDLYYTPAYHRAFERNNDGSATCFVFRDGGDCYLNCFLLNSVNALGYALDREYFDIQSVYGYSGILSSSENIGFLTSADRMFSEYCRDNNLIAEFSRYHPILKNEKFAGADTAKLDRTTVIVDLTRGYQNVWDNHYSTNARNMVRKAQRVFTAEHVTDPTTADIENFFRLYDENMVKVNAQAYYRFSSDFFFQFFSILKSNIVLFKIKDENGLPVCSAIFLHFNKYIHYHLSGRSIAANNSVNSFLIDAAVKFACENGYETLHLGGGRSSAPDDSLLKFKKTFSELTGEFFIAKKIYQQPVYLDVIEQWKAKFPELTAVFHNQLLRYRNVR
jgi:hypothetical protein